MMTFFEPQCIMDNNWT